MDGEVSRFGLEGGWEGVGHLSNHSVIFGVARYPRLQAFFILLFCGISSTFKGLVQEGVEWLFEHLIGEPIAGNTTGLLLRMIGLTT